MNRIQRLSIIVITTVAILLLGIPTLASILPPYEVPDYGISVLLICGALSAFFFARRRLARN